MAEETQQSKNIRFVYEKARHHRTLHADGAWSAVTPHAEVQVSFYNDLRRMPISVTHEIQDNALSPGKPQADPDLVREVDVTVVMNVVVARATVELLNQMIAKADQALAQAEQKEQKQAPRVDIYE